MGNSKLIITTIASPNATLKSYAKVAPEYGFDFIVIGDKRSPDNFKIENCDFWSIERQLKESGSEFAKKAPVGHYSRKNLGYILAKRAGAEWIVETDDDNLPNSGFWGHRMQHHEAKVIENSGWINTYCYFTERVIWPRGFPLERINSQVDFSIFPTRCINCPIQQGLADGDPDVDAIYRLTLPLPFNFEKREGSIALGRNTWCPFNSQNTSWHELSFLLTYLPSYCSFRMTDIWRSFVAQRICWENNWFILFYNATVCQERNSHNLLRDFSDELSGYLNNGLICSLLEDLPLKAGIENIPDNLLICYRELIANNIIGKEEAALLESWIKDMLA
jgi:hypothetical protein